MQLYERIKYLRKSELKVTQDIFAAKINMSRSNLGNIETGKISVTDRVIADICDAYSVNREWLEHGTGEMFDESSLSLVDQLVEKYQLSDIAKKVLEVYVELDPNDKKVFDNFIEKVVAAKNERPDVSGVEAAMQQYQIPETIPKKTVTVRTAARSNDGAPITNKIMTAEEYERLRNSPKVDPDL